MNVVTCNTDSSFVSFMPLGITVVVPFLFSQCFFGHLETSSSLSCFNLYPTLDKYNDSFSACCNVLQVYHASKNFYNFSVHKAAHRPWTQDCSGHPRSKNVRSEQLLLQVTKTKNKLCVHVFRS